MPGEAATNGSSCCRPKPSKVSSRGPGTSQSGLLPEWFGVCQEAGPISKVPAHALI